MPGGRPTIYTEELAERLARHAEAGIPLRHVAPLEDISTACMFEWMQRGRDGEAPFDQFVERIAKARAKFVSASVSRVMGAQGGKDAAPWTNVAWMLERQFAEDFKSVQSVEHSGSVQTIRVDLPDGLTLDQLRAAAGKAPKS